MTSKFAEPAEDRDGVPSPEATSPIAPAASLKKRRRRRASAKTIAERKGLVDIGAILNEPLEVLKNGKPGKMPALELAIRQQVKKALTEKSLPAILAVIKVAIDNDLVASPPEPPHGGIFIVPKFLTDEEQFRIFGNQEDRSMQIIFDILRPYYEQWKEQQVGQP